MSATTTDNAKNDGVFDMSASPVTRGPNSRNPLTAKPADQKRYRPRLFSRPKRSRAIPRRAGRPRPCGPILLILLNTLVARGRGHTCTTLICR